MKVYLGPQDAWLEPYLRRVEKMVPLKKLVGIKGFRVPLDAIEQADGRISTEDGKKFVITIRMYGQEWKRAGKRTFKAVRHVPRTLEDILFTLAHELAHLRHWDHTPEHVLLSVKLLKAFFKEAKRQGIKDFQKGAH